MHYPMGYCKDQCYILFQVLFVTEQTKRFEIHVTFVNYTYSRWGNVEKSKAIILGGGGG